MRHAPDDHRLPVHVGGHLRTRHRLLGGQHRDPGVLPPEQATEGGVPSRPRVAARARRTRLTPRHRPLPFGRPAHLDTGGMLAAIVGGWQRAHVHGVFRAPFTVTSATTTLNAPESAAGRPGEGHVEIFGDVGPTTPYFDVLASNRSPMSGSARRVNSLRGPECRNFEPEFDDAGASGPKTLPLKLDVYDLFNGRPSRTRAT